MTDSITPPRELMEQWASEKSYDERDWLYEFHIATRAAQCGTDRELEACCEWLLRFNYDEQGVFMAQQLRAARRPKPPSLKEQALLALNKLPPNRDCGVAHDTIRRALEQLPDNN